MDALPARQPSSSPARTRGLGACALIGLVCGVGVPVVAWALRLGAFSLVLLPLVALGVGALVGGSTRVSPRSAGGAFFAGAMVWAVIGAGGGLLWPVRVLLGAVVALVAGAAFATAVAWRQRRRSTPAAPTLPDRATHADGRQPERSGCPARVPVCSPASMNTSPLTTV